MPKVIQYWGSTASSTDTVPEADMIYDIASSTGDTGLPNLLDAADLDNIMGKHTDSSSSGAPSITIDMVAAKILPPLIPLRDEKGFVYDSGTLAAKCPRRHIHKYYIVDIMNRTPQCTTCKHGGSWAKTLRETAENMLSVPFILADKRRAPNSLYEYFNPILGVVLACFRKSPKAETITTGDILIICFAQCSSAGSIARRLKSVLPSRQSLTDDQREAVNRYIPAERKVFHNDPLPFTPELAAMNTAQGLNVIEHNAAYLRLEDC